MTVLLMLPVWRNLRDVSLSDTRAADPAGARTGRPPATPSLQGAGALLTVADKIHAI